MAKGDVGSFGTQQRPQKVCWEALAGGEERETHVSMILISLYIPHTMHQGLLEVEAGRAGRPGKRAPRKMAQRSSGLGSVAPTSAQ